MNRNYKDECGNPIHGYRVDDATEAILRRVSNAIKAGALECVAKGYCRLGRDGKIEHSGIGPCTGRADGSRKENR